MPARCCGGEDRTAGQPGFFDLDQRYAAWSAAGDPLGRLAAVVDFELFRPELNAALERSDRARGGRPPYDAVLMFKILVLQTLYTSLTTRPRTSLGRLSFMRFSAAHDGRQLDQLLDPGNTARPVWADTAYRSAANLALLAPAWLGAAVPAAEAARQTDVTAHRPRQRQPDAGPGAIEHVFAAQKCRFGLIIARSASPAPPPRLGLAIWSPT